MLAFTVYSVYIHNMSNIGRKFIPLRSLLNMSLNYSMFVNPDGVELEIVEQIGDIVFLRDDLGRIVAISLTYDLLDRKRFTEIRLLNADNK